MSKEVIAREPAEAEVKSWEDRFDTDLSSESSEKLIRVVMRGRITLDEQTESFTLKLRTPIQLDNGETVNDLTFQEPKASQARDMGSDRDLATVLKILSAISGQSLGVLGRLGLKDLVVVGELFNFFV